MTSGAPLGSVFGLVFFNIIINNTDSKIGFTSSRFADDPKLNGALDTVGRKDAIQRDPEKLEKWSYGNFIFKKSKCNVLHLVQGNSRNKHRMGKELTNSSSVKKDLKVLMDEKLNMNQQHARKHTNSHSRKPTYPGIHQEMNGQQAERDNSPLYL